MKNKIKKIPILSINEIENHPAFIFLKKCSEPIINPEYGPIFNEETVSHDLFELGLVDLIKNTCGIDKLMEERKKWPQKWFEENRTYYRTNRRSALISLILSSVN